MPEIITTIDMFKRQSTKKVGARNFIKEEEFGELDEPEVIDTP